MPIPSFVTPRIIVAALIVLALGALPAAAGTKCRGGAFALSDAQDIAGVRAAVERACPCATFDGSSYATNRGA